MNLAHLHLIVNHLPVVGIPLVLLFLGYGLYTKNLLLQRFSLKVLFIVSLLLLPVYFSGEPAEKIVEHLPGVTESLIESHEDAALFTLIVTLIMGALAAVALYFRKNEKRFGGLSKIVFVVGCLSVASLLYTANLGGQVRHTEVRSQP